MKVMTDRKTPLFIKATLLSAPDKLILYSYISVGSRLDTYSILFIFTLSLYRAIMLGESLEHL